MFAEVLILIKVMSCTYCLASLRNLSSEVTKEIGAYVIACLK
jgi:hypothetical protein